MQHVLLGLVLSMLGGGQLERPGPDDNETAWTQWLAQEMAGEAEHRNPDGSRVDVLTAGRAWEVDWADQSLKWAEGCGQAILYRAWTNRAGGVILLVGRSPSEQEIKNIMRCRIACCEADLAMICVDVSNGRWVSPDPPTPAMGPNGRPMSCQ